MTDMQPPHRRWDDGDIRERLAKFEVAAAEIGPLRRVVHDMASNVAVLLDASERAEKAHDEMMLELRAARTEARAELAQHDLRDDTRFASVATSFTGIDRRMGAIEIKLGVHDGRVEAELHDVDHTHDRRNAMYAGALGVLAAIVSAVVLAVLAPICEHVIARFFQ